MNEVSLSFPRLLIKTNSEAEQKQNLDVFNFNISEENMKLLGALETVIKNNPHGLWQNYKISGNLQ